MSITAQWNGLHHVSGRAATICWVVTDGKPGMENQCLGLVEAMGLVATVKRLHLHRLWRELGLKLDWSPGFALKRNGIVPPWPDLLIASGRTSVVASLYVKAASGGRTFTVQIQRPVVSIDRFDRVIVPQHDQLRGENVILMSGALHRVTPELLRSEAARLAPRVAHLPQPYVAVMLGGGSTAISPLRRWSAYRLGRKQLTEIADQLVALARNEDVGLLVTASRRTDPADLAHFRAILRGCPAVIWDGRGENPYFGILGLANSFIVTCDSVNMISEACSTDKPVQIIKLPGRSQKFARFHQNLMAADRIRYFNGTLAHWHPEPLREKERVAALVWQAYESHCAISRRICS